MFANALIMPKLLLKLMALRLTREPSLEPPAQEPLHLHVTRLEHILQQVRKDGFHVEYISDLGWQNVEIGEIIASVNRWAAQLSLKVSINRERGIFFFER